MKTSYCVAFMAMAFCAVSAAGQDYSTPVAPDFVAVMEAEEGHYARTQMDALNLPRQFRFTEGDARVFVTPNDFDRNGVPEHLFIDFDDLTEVDFPWVRIDLGSAQGLSVGTYPNARSDTDSENTLDTGFNHITCGDIGQFTIAKFDYERQNVGSEESPAYVYHTTALNMQLRSACEGDLGGPEKVITIAYTDTPKGGDDGGGDDDGGDSDTPPPPPSFQLQIPIEFDIEPVLVSNGATQRLEFSTAVSGAFNSDIHLFVETDALEHEDFHASITPNVVPAPGIGDAKLTITTGPLTFPRVYSVKLIASANDQRFERIFLVQVLCDPPFILGTSQPKNISAANGSQVTLEVTPSGTGPFFYQWYKGMPGMTRTPVLAANDSKLIFTTRETAAYWVRVSNACGTVDSGSATVTTIGTLTGPARRRGAGS